MRWCGLVFVLAACSGRSTNPLIGEADAKALVAQWQGVWVMPYSYSSTGRPYVVYAVEGTKVTQWLGDEAKPGTIEILAPCLARIKQGSLSHYMPFAFDPRGQLLVHNRVGVKRGDTSFACIGDKEVVVSTRGTCRLHGGGLRQPDDDAGETVPCSKLGDLVAADGDLLVPSEAAREPAFHAASLEDAKQRAAHGELGP